MKRTRHNGEGGRGEATGAIYHERDVIEARLWRSDVNNAGLRITNVLSAATFFFSFLHRVSTTRCIPNKAAAAARIHGRSRIAFSVQLDKKACSGRKDDSDSQHRPA